MIANLFEAQDTQVMIERIHQLTPDTKQLWGKMSVGQMLAHCNVSYEMVYEGKHPAPKGLMKWMLKTFVKKIVTGEKPYGKNKRTAPQFVMTDPKDFESEKKRLIKYIQQTQKLGGSYFEGKESASFGVLNEREWNNMFSRHLDHHLSQFGV